MFGFLKKLTVKKPATTTAKPVEPRMPEPEFNRLVREVTAHTVHRYPTPDQLNRREQTMKKIFEDSLNKPRYAPAQSPVPEAHIGKGTAQTKRTRATSSTVSSYDYGTSAAAQAITYSTYTNTINSSSSSSNCDTSSSSNSTSFDSGSCGGGF